MSSSNTSFASVFFQSTPCLSSHILALRDDPETYARELRSLCESGTITVVSTAVKARIVAALHITSKHDLLYTVLELCEATDIVKALTLLDRPRAVRQLQRKIQKIESDHPDLVQDQSQTLEEEDERTNSEGGAPTDNESAPPPRNGKRRRKIDAHRENSRKLQIEIKDKDHVVGVCQNAHENTAVQELIQSSSVSGALARKVRQWAKENVKSDNLEYVLLSLPTAPWKKLADLVHFTPNDFAVPYFLESAFDPKHVPEDSFVSRMRALVDKGGPDVERRFSSLAEEFPQTYLQYSFIRTQPTLMSDPAIVEHLARNVPLNTVLWWGEELIKGKTMDWRLVDELSATFHVSRDVAEEALKTNGNNLAHAGEAILDDLDELRQAVKRRKKKTTASHTKAAGTEVANIIAERLKTEGVECLCRADSKSKATYGKLVERILTFRRMKVHFSDDIIPLAAYRLDGLKCYWQNRINAKVAVFGDASSSMQPAIEAATVFASMVSVCFEGELSFFASSLLPSPHARPTNVHETLEVCNRIKASGCTSLAAALWPYYDQEKFVDMIALVTDEFENEPHQGFYFAPLLAEYKKKVNESVVLIIVCVGQGSQEFRQTLAMHNIDYRVVYIDGRRPDLSKFDALLGQMAMLSSCNTAINTEQKELEEEQGEEDFVVL